MANSAAVARAHLIYFWEPHLICGRENLNLRELLWILTREVSSVFDGDSVFCRGPFYDIRLPPSREQVTWGSTLRFPQVTLVFRYGWLVGIPLEPRCATSRCVAKEVITGSCVICIAVATLLCQDRIHDETISRYMQNSSQRCGGNDSLHK